MLVTIPVFISQVALSQLLEQLPLWLPFYFPEVIIDVIRWFLVIALVEELFKYFVVKLTVLKSKELDEPVDVMVYMVVVALGFAALENIFYLFSPLETPLDLVIRKTIAVSFIRFIGATFLHTLCSALVGYFLALSLLRGKKKLVMTGILLATALHGLYNFSIITLEAPLSFLISLLVLVGLSIFIIYDFNEIKKLKSICKI